MEPGPSKAAWAVEEDEYAGFAAAMVMVGSSSRQASDIGQSLYRSVGHRCRACLCVIGVLGVLVAG